MQIGFIGQGFVGKNIADDFERRGYDAVRYSLEAPYMENKAKIADCEVVFIAVPTPSTVDGFDVSIVEQSINLVSKGAIVVVKSTVLPGTSQKLQDAHPDKVVLFSPEFLCEATAAYDAANPMLNVIGVSYDSAGHRKAAATIKDILPQSEHNFIVSAQAAELFKYAHNVHGFMRVILSNVLYDLAEKMQVDWSDVKEMMDADIMMSPYYNAPAHKGGRGAGGNCFIKDMAAFSQLYRDTLQHDDTGGKLLRLLEKKNLELLAATEKDQDIVKGVYGQAGASISLD